MVSSIDPSEPEPEVLLFQTSPLGNLDGIVQRDDETVYFYLHERQQEHAAGVFGMRAVWVQNLVRGPLVLDRGRIVQEGTHEELLSQEGAYQRLWSIQGDLEAQISRDLSGDRRA